MKKQVLLLLFVSLMTSSFAQKEPPTFLSNATYLGVSQPLKDLPNIVPTHNNDPENFKYGNN